jgi:oligopeptide/dipeptide ABC transporter ATP-binding protein
MELAPSVSPILEVRGLQTHLFSKRGVGRAVANVNFVLHAGETLGLVGESGSGKSLTCLSVLRLNPQPASKVVGGEVLFHGDDLLNKSDAEIREYRGKKIAMILQDPMRALNPVLTIGNQLYEALMLHRGLRGQRLEDTACELLERVRIPDPAAGLNAYPHHFSGGMRQRVVGAIAMAGNPEILIADEPTTALDVTVQEEFLDLLKTIQNEAGLGILFVTHDFAVVARMCDRVAVMYAGKIVETATTDALFDAPKHPYTKALLRSVPDVSHKDERLYSIDGQPPSVFAPLPGCSFAPRCEFATDRCRSASPPEIDFGNRSVSCWLYEDKQ